jgi:hypothetical protein
MLGQVRKCKKNMANNKDNGFIPTVTMTVIHNDE